MKGKVLIASHDAGGAEIISSLIRSLSKIDPIFFLDGPAVKIFKKTGIRTYNTKLIKLKNLVE